MKLVVLGLSITSSWGNGHATTYRSLLKAFAARGHEIDFYEWDAPYYRAHRDLPNPPYCEVTLYEQWRAVRDHVLGAAREAEAVLVGSYVHDGATLVDELAGACADRLFFFDIDTPVTVASLRQGTCPFLREDQVGLFRRYLSFTSGPLLTEVLEGDLGARDARPLHCCVDADLYRPVEPDPKYGADLAYLGTYAVDRQEPLERLLVGAALRSPGRTFIVAGPQYPERIRWPRCVRRFEHVPPPDHPAFYSSAAWQLNLTRADMRRAGWSPSVRLFEAAACGAAILSDSWPGLEDFLTPGEEVLLPRSAAEVVDVIESTHPDDRRAIGSAARSRIMSGHTSVHRARELEELLSVGEPARGSEMVGGAAG